MVSLGTRFRSDLLATEVYTLEWIAWKQLHFVVGQQVKGTKLDSQWRTKSEPESLLLALLGRDAPDNKELRGLSIHCPMLSARLPFIPHQFSNGFPRCGIALAAGKRTNCQTPLSLRSFCGHPGTYRIPYHTRAARL